MQFYFSREAHLPLLSVMKTAFQKICSSNWSFFKMLALHFSVDTTHCDNGAFLKH